MGKREEFAALSIPQANTREKDDKGPTAKQGQQLLSLLSFPIPC
jgi:hypothetical protein